MTTHPPLRLLIVTRESEQDRAYGLGKTLQPIVARLQTKGHNVEYFCKATCSDLHQHWQPRFQKWLQPLLSGLAPSIAERIVQGMAAATRAIRQKYTHIWVHDPWLVIGVVLGMMRRRKRLKKQSHLIITEHGLGSFIWSACQDGISVSDTLYRRLLSLERLILQYADAVFTPSHAAMDALQRDLQLSYRPEHFRVMGYGRPETASPEAERRMRHQTLQQLGLTGIINTDTPLLLAVGRLSPVKQFDKLIDIAACLQHRHQLPCQIMIAGSGDDYFLQEKARQHQLRYPPIVHFADTIALPLSVADFYISTCPAESYGQANREALAAGCVTLALTSGGSGEVLGTGALLQPLSVERIAERIAFLWHSPEHYRYWQNEALREAQRWPDWNQITDHYEAVFYALNNRKR